MGVMLIVADAPVYLPPTDRQFAVLLDVYNGLSNAQIAEKSHVTEQTVKNTLYGAYERLEDARLISAAVHRNKRTLAAVWLHRFLTERGDWCVPGIRAEMV
jgi:DNA-binding NarL/FixJ family response regulator